MSFSRDSPAPQFKSINSLALSLLYGPMFTSLHGFWNKYTLDFMDLRYMESKSESVSHSVVSNSLQPYGLQPTSLLCPWDSPGENIGVSCHSLLQGLFPTQGSNQGLLHYRQILYCLSHQESQTFYFTGQFYVYNQSKLISQSVTSLVPETWDGLCLKGAYKMVWNQGGCLG